MNANNAASNTNRNNAGSAKEGEIFISGNSFRPCLGTTNHYKTKRTDVRCAAVDKSAKTSPACRTSKEMKKTRVLTKPISVEDVMEAAKRAFRGHSGKPDVKRFKQEMEGNCQKLHRSLQDGTWRDVLSYHKLEKTNNNGKVRHILSPSLETRILQHLMLSLLVPVYEKKDNLNGLN